MSGGGQRGSGDARLREHTAIVGRLLHDWPDAVAEFSPAGTARRADVFVDGVAIECQVGPIDEATVIGRCEDYARAGIDCLWIWGGRRLPHPFQHPRRGMTLTAHAYWEAVPEPPGVAEFLDTQVSPTLLETQLRPFGGVLVALGPLDALRFEEWWIGRPDVFDGVRRRPLWRRLLAAGTGRVPYPTRTPREPAARSRS